MLFRNPAMTPKAKRSVSPACLQQPSTKPCCNTYRCSRHAECYNLHGRVQRTTRFSNVAFCRRVAPARWSIPQTPEREVARARCGFCAACEPNCSTLPTGLITPADRDGCRLSARRSHASGDDILIRPAPFEPARGDILEEASESTT